MSVQLLSCNLLPLTIYAIIQSYKCSIYGSRDVPTDWTGNLTTLYKIGQWSHIDEFYRFYLRHSKLPLQCSEKYFNNSECKLGKNCRVLLTFRSDFISTKKWLLFFKFIWCCFLPLPPCLPSGAFDLGSPKLTLTKSVKLPAINIFDCTSN